MQIWCFGQSDYKWSREINDHVYVVFKCLSVFTRDWISLKAGCLIESLHQQEKQRLYTQIMSTVSQLYIIASFFWTESELRHYSALSIKFHLYFHLQMLHVFGMFFHTTSSALVQAGFFWLELGSCWSRGAIRGQFCSAAFRMNVEVSKNH